MTATHASAIAAAFEGGFSLGVIVGAVALYLVAALMRLIRDRAR